MRAPTVPPSTPFPQTGDPGAFAASFERLAVGALLCLAVASVAACGGQAQHALKSQSMQEAARAAASLAKESASPEETAPPEAVVVRDSAQPTPDNPSDNLEREVASRLSSPVALTQAWTQVGPFTSYLAPDAVAGFDGGVDVVVHFHGASLAEADWRSGVELPVAIVNVSIPGYGVGPYRDAFADPARFRALVDDVVARVGGAHVRRLGLIAWSAGYGAVQQVLADEESYPAIDTVVLLDGLHADYVDGSPDPRALAPFARFAHDAAAGRKQMIVTHSSVVPGGYASTGETASALLDDVGAERVEETRTNARGMVEWYHADQNGLHVRGFRGGDARDHLEQVHLVGDVMHAFVAPHWAQLDVLEERHVLASR